MMLNFAISIITFQSLKSIMIFMYLVRLGYRACKVRSGLYNPRYDECDAVLCHLYFECLTWVRGRFF